MSNPFDLPATFARLWVDSSLQVMQATTELWSGLLNPASARSRTSTVSPWWMPPQQRSETPWPAMSPWATAALAWGPFWAGGGPLSQLTVPLLAGSPNPWMPAARTEPASNPFAVWQRMWLQAAAPQSAWPWQPTAAPAASALSVDPWQPVAAAYRTANGHAMAAVLRTMADVVEPKPRPASFADFWPYTPGTRH